MNYKKLIRLVPFFILLVLTVSGWIEILTVTHVAMVRHLIGAGLVLVNIVLYFFSFRTGVLLTGIILLLATINLAAFTASITTKQYWFGISEFRLTLPAFQPLALLLLVIFLVFNLKYLLEAFRKELG